jgi:subtilisin family serine protease
VTGVTTAVLATTLGVTATPSEAASPATPLRAVRTTNGHTLNAGNYIVVLKDKPLTTYTGNVRGYAATKPAAGRKVDVSSAAAKRYAGYLKQRQDSVMRTVGAAARTRYDVTLNGFAGHLSAEQAAKLSESPQVQAVLPDRILKADTTNTANFLALSGRTGVWAALGGQANAGKGVVVGVIDTGYRPESASFAGKPVTTLAPQPVGVPYRVLTGRIAMKKGDGSTFFGVCQAGAGFTSSTCNSKAIGARYFASNLLAGGIKLASDELLSPRDTDSHGTHTASTATGNPVAHAVVAGRDFGATSGMAPGAKVSVYKALWRPADDPAAAIGFGSDLISAIDAAVADGVDVINYSVGPGGGSNGIEADDLAFLNAAAAGVFVSASAGNSGPGPDTVSHLAPWETTVAAATTDLYYGTVVLGNGQKYRGSTVNKTGLPATPAVLASAAAGSGVTAADAALCLPNSLDPGKATGKIVVCDRGPGRVAKSAEVARAGGVGMVLVNATPGVLLTDIHAVPTIQVDTAVGTKIKAYASSASSATISLVVRDITGAKPEPVPQVADFSSRGPAETVGGNLLKPDITAPGVSVIAAIVPSAANKNSAYGPENGTSMSAPHIAGLAALILQKNPLWSPARVKSAMMTTARDTVTTSGRSNTNPFAQGAGFVNPSRFLNPGLVYDAGVSDYYGFLEGIGLDTGTGVNPTDGTEVNVPSIAIGGLPGTQTVTRRVTALKAGTYTARATVGKVGVTVSPSKLVFTRAGQTKSFTVKFMTSKATLAAFTTGFLTWTGPSRTTVRIPLAVRPVAVAAPSEVHENVSTPTGTGSYSVKLGVSPLPLSVKGLVKGNVTAGSVTAGPLSAPTVSDASNVVLPVTVAAGTTLLRAETRDDTAGDDIDLYVYDSAGTLVGISGSAAANEVVDLLAPGAGTYYVHVHGFATRAGGSAAFSLRTFLVGNSAAGDLTASPSPLRVETRPRRR